MEGMGADVADFSLRNVLTVKSSIFHMHWPDLVLNGRLSWVKIPVLFFLLLFLKVKNNKIVYTVHNPIPKSSNNDALIALYYQIIDSFVDGYIFPSALAKQTWASFNSDRFMERKHVIIPLGIQSEVAALGAIKPSELNHKWRDNFLLFVGRITDFKDFAAGIEAVLDTKKLDQLKILVAGSVQDQTAGESIAKLEKRHPARVRLIARHMADEEINWLVNNAAAVIINYPAVNSGVATLAASSNQNLIIFDQTFRDSFVEQYGYKNTFDLSGFADFANTARAENGEKTKAPSDASMESVARKTLEFFKEL